MNLEQLEKEREKDIVQPKLRSLSISGRNSFVMRPCDEAGATSTYRIKLLVERMREYRARERVKGKSIGIWWKHFDKSTQQPSDSDFSS